jgi:hypothetical protein
MVEHTAEIKTADVMAGTTIKTRFRMTLGFPHRVVAIVTGIAPMTHDVGAAMVNEGI